MSQRRAASALVRAVDGFLAECGHDLVKEDEDLVWAVRRLADEFTRPSGDVGATGP